MNNKEIEKPIVPKYVADWYENHKYNFERTLPQECRVARNKKENTELDDFQKWVKNVYNKPLETITKMKLFGYKVNEKLYTVEIPNPNGLPNEHLVLYKDVEKVVLTRFSGESSEKWKTFYRCQLTEKEIKKDYAWAFPLLAKEVQ